MYDQSEREAAQQARLDAQVARSAGTSTEDFREFIRELTRMSHPPNNQGPTNGG